MTVKHTRGDTLRYKGPVQKTSLVGKYIFFTMKIEKTDADPGVLQWVFEAPDEETYVNGTPYIEVPAANMDGVPVGVYHFDVQIVDPASDVVAVDTVIIDTIEIVQDVTRAVSLPSSSGVPQILSFILPALHTTDTNIPITTFVAENHTHYIFKPTTTPDVAPALDDAGWIDAGTPAEIIAAGAEGNYTYSAWVKNATTISQVFAGQLCVVDLPSAISFSAATASVDEGAQIDLTITRTGNPHGAITVSLAQIAGALEIGPDYTLSTQSVTFASGDAAAKVVTLSASADLTTEGSETATLQLTIVSGQATYGANRTAVVTVVDTSLGQTVPLLYEKTFETDLLTGVELLALPMTPTNCENTKFTRVLDPVSGAGYCMKITQTGSGGVIDGVPTVEADSCLIAADYKHRALWAPRDSENNKIRIRPGIEYWLGYRILFPAGFESQYLDDFGAQIIHFQCNRGSPHGETPAINITGNLANVVMEFSRSYVNASSQQVLAETVGVNMTRGIWQNIIMNFIHEQDATGFLKVWVNDELKMNSVGQTDTLSSIKPYTQYNTMNMGLYWGDQPRPHDWTIYLDNFRHVDGANGYAAVDPAQ